MTDQLAAEIFRYASESIEVPAVPVEAVVAEARAGRRRRVRLVVVGVAAAALVVGGLTWSANRDPGPSEELAPAVVTREVNPVKVAWYANGRLHLAKVTVTIPDVTDLVELNGGAVYGDHDGTVAFVAADGERRRIGEKDPSVPLVASPGDGWAAWVDPGSGGATPPTLVVYDVSNGRLLDAKEVSSGDTRPIAIDQHRVYYESPEGAFSWAPGTEVPVELDRAGLADVQSATRVYQLNRRIDMVQSFFSVAFQRPGTTAQLSEAGILVLTKQPGPGVADGQPFRPLVYDARSGDQKPSGVGEEERAVDATFGRNNTVVYLVAQVADLDGGSDLDGNVDPLLALRSCDLGTNRCTDVAPVQTGTDRPVLAH